jgi:DNA-binding Lrp family transcriptional regulator
MAVKAFILIEAEVGKTGEIVDAAQKVGGVKSADSVAGPYDIVAMVEVADLDALGSLVRQVHSISGVCKTTTLIGMKF